PAAPVINTTVIDAETTAITGTAEAGAFVFLTLGGNVRNFAADGAGHWSYTLQASDIAAMGQGPETLSAIAVAIPGNGGAAGTREITVDTEGGGEPDSTAPVLQSAVVNGNTLTLTYDEALDAAHQPSASYFVVSVTNNQGTTSGRSISSMTVSGNQLVLTLG